MDTRVTHPRHLNRELGLLAFNERVLAAACDASVPLLERLRFLCIVSSNLDEFFEIRVAGLKETILQDPAATGPDGLQAHEVLQRVAIRAREIVRRQYALYNDVLLPALEREGVAVLRRDRWTEVQAAWAYEYFEAQMRPVLTPIGLDPAHPFPRVLNKSLNFAVELDGADAFGRDTRIAIVQAPRVLPRLIRVPVEIARLPHGFVTLGAILRRFVHELFPGMTVHACDEFRVTRNSELFVDEEEVTNLREALAGELHERRFGDAVRLEVSATTSATMARFLMEQFELGPDDLYRVDGPVNLVRLNQLPDAVDRPDLKYPAMTPEVPADFIAREDAFSTIAAGDVLLHHPYESFQPVLDLLRKAAVDPAVVAIKQTIYRTGHESAFMDSLVLAAKNGKEVTVVVELMARFDEEVNIGWAAKLEEVGAHVVYGVVGHKTHAKMSMIVRREAGRLKRYVHIGTGNYHPRTARLYSDFGLFTADPQICADVGEVFQGLTGLGVAPRLARCLQAPFSLHEGMIRAIRAEAANARSGRPARVIAKMNALLEQGVIDALYDASSAGVRVDLIVRGVCALRPQVPGLSENITVRSIIGRFLEHHRVFYFENDGDPRVFLSSADWMDRNFFRRVELCFPVLDPRLKARVIREGLEIYLEDDESAWEMGPDGEYAPPARRHGRSAQRALIELLAGSSSRSALPDPVAVLTQTDR